MTTITGDQKFLKNINRMALVRLIRSKPGLSRADVANETGLTKSTISLLAQELIDEGWLTEDDALATGSIGRRPTPLRLDTKRLVLIGADLTQGRIDVVATTLTGEVIELITRKFEAQDVNTVLSLLARSIAELSRNMLEQGRTVLGVGLGVPGPVHANTGILHFSNTLGWRDVPLRTTLSQLLAQEGLPQLPLFVQRRAATAALGEIEFACTPVEEPLLYIHLGMSVGAGVFVSDRLLSGHGGFAGDVGHQQLLPGGPLCSCGRQGCAEALISLGAMARAAGCNPETFRARLAQGDAGAHAALREGGHHLGVLMHNLWSTFDPAQIVVGGPCCTLGSEYIQAAQATLQTLAANAGMSVPPVSAARFGEHAVAIGATALVLHQMIRPV